MDVLSIILAAVLSVSTPSGASISGSATAPPITPAETLSLLEYSYLQSELNLASRPQFYLVLDIPDRVLRIKARGLVFKEWPIRSLRSWGDTISPLPQAVEKKDSLADPRRPEIKAVLPAQQSPADASSVREEATAEAPFQLEALELPDMPTSYTLTLGGGLSVTVHPQRVTGSVASWETASAYIGRIVDALAWNAMVSVRYLQSDSKPRLDITVDPIAAQEIYWHVPPGTQVLIVGRP